MPPPSQSLLVNNAACKGNAFAGSHRGAIKLPCTTPCRRVLPERRSAGRLAVPRGPCHVRSTNNNAESGDTPPTDTNTNSSWQFFVLKLPLLYSSTLARTNDHYLSQRGRKRWWKRGRFPQVPVDTVEKTVLPEPEFELWQKFIPLGLVFFCASFNLTILQNLKDAMMVVAGGAETLPFLMSLGVLPASLGFFVLYNKLVSVLPEKAVFYAALLPLLSFYTLFATVLYPAAPQLHPYALMDSLLTSWPAGLHGLLRAAGNWTYSLFFCFAELWGSVVISVLFWSLANEVCTVEEAKIIYPLMGISANIALVVAGKLIKWINGPVTGGNLQLSLWYNVGTVIVLSGAMMLAKAFIDKKLLSGGEAAPGTKQPKKKKKKRSTMGESIALLKRSPKILNLALLVVCYGVGHRLFEYSWKGQLRVLYPSVQAYQSLLADVSIWTGATTIALMLTSRFIFQAGWGVAAVITPLVMLLAGTAFFGCSLAAQLPFNLPMEPAAVAALGVAAGCVTQVFARSSKYSLFDPAKEMVYIEMDKDEKQQGKAAVDLVGSQIGKSGASWATQAALLVLGSLSAALPFLSVMFVAVILTWVRSTLQLQRLMDDTERQRAEGPASGTIDTMATMESTDEGDGGDLPPAPSGGKAPAGGAAAAANLPAVTTNGNGNSLKNGSANGNGNGTHGSVEGEAGTGEGSSVTVSARPGYGLA